MGVERSDLKAALERAQRRLVEHPGYIEHMELMALEVSITAVSIPNWRELTQLLDAAATNEELALELIQNVRPPIVRERFHGAVAQRLHNYLASTTSLVDHVRRLMRGRSGSIAEELERRKEEVLRNPIVRFMSDLRNYTLHRRLPFFAHRLSMTGVNTPEQKMESEVELDVAQLLEWDGWSEMSRQFLKNHGKVVPIRPIVKEHGPLLFDLNTWLHNELAVANDEALEEANQLVIDANTVLTGGDREEAERISRRFEAGSDPGQD